MARGAPGQGWCSEPGCREGEQGEQALGDVLGEQGTVGTLLSDFVLASQG